jgi:putative tryptophan/tyrosine transport system substrate-binding protein
MFLAIAGAISIAAPAFGEDPMKTPRVGIVHVGAPGTERTGGTAGLRQGLADRGYVEGRSIILEDRYANGHPERVPGIISELLALKVDVLVTGGVSITRDAQRLTSTVPIVSVSGDLVSAGLVANLARPGGNITGMSMLMTEYSVKWLELLKEAVPNLHHVAVLFNADNPGNLRQLERMREVVPRLGLELAPFSAPPAEIDGALAAVTRAIPDGLVVPGDPFFDSISPRLVAFAAERRLPTIYGIGSYARQGGLMSYSVNIFDVNRRAAGYVDRILKGAKPGDLPVEQPTKFELIINLRTAKALGLTIPPPLLLRADEVIQ